MLETEASLAGRSCFVSEGDTVLLHPVVYVSSSPNQHYHITEVETLAIVWAVQYSRAYILGHHCLMLTDHAACVSLLNKVNRFPICKVGSLGFNHPSN